MASWELRLHDATSMPSVPYHGTLTQEEVSMVTAKYGCYWMHSAILNQINMSRGSITNFFNLPLPPQYAMHSQMAILLLSGLSPGPKDTQRKVCLWGAVHLKYPERDAKELEATYKREVVTHMWYIPQGLGKVWLVYSQGQF